MLFPASMRISRRQTIFLAALLLLFLFRLGFGLCSEFWYEDEQQIYLLGLKFYSTGAWPYYGPDVTYGIQIPGALQSLLVAVPLFILPIAEAPFILLNILSFSALCLLAWYCSRRLPETPAWIIWAWLLTAPWTVNYSTHIVNPSYVLAGSILFFVGVLETYPQTSRHLISPQWCNFMMGLALFWVMQLHMSWVLLPPYVLVSFYFQYKSQGKGILASLGWFVIGGAITGSLLLPTFLKYGMVGGIGGAGGTIAFNFKNVRGMLNLPEGILARFLSFASFELARFIGDRSVKRLAFLRQQPELIPFVIFLWAVGIAQPIVMIIRWFSKNHPQKDWQAIKYLTLFTVLLLYVSFSFAIKPPSSHTFYVTLPIAFIYSFYCWSPYLSRRGWQIFAGIVIACGIIFHTGLAINNLSRISLYVDRSIPQSAIELKDYRGLGERRPGARY